MIRSPEIVNFTAGVLLTYARTHSAMIRDGPLTPLHYTPHMANP